MTPRFCRSSKTRSTPRRLMILMPLALVRNLTQRLRRWDQKRLSWILGRKRRLVLLCACETRLPVLGRLPVTTQIRDMLESNWGKRHNYRTHLSAGRLGRRPQLQRTVSPLLRITQVSRRCSNVPKRVQCSTDEGLLADDYARTERRLGIRRLRPSQARKREGDGNSEDRQCCKAPQHKVESYNVGNQSRNWNKRDSGQTPTEAHH